MSAPLHVCGLAGTAASQANLANKARQWEGRLTGTEGCQYQVALSWELCQVFSKGKDHQEETLKNAWVYELRELQLGKLDFKID